MDSRDRTFSSSPEQLRNSFELHDGSEAWRSPLLSPQSDQMSDRFRSVSRDESMPMNHPTPDLQAIQGAYVGNIERLEQHAERISFHSDMGEEIRKLRHEQKRSESRRSSALISPTRQLSTSSPRGASLALSLDALAGDYEPNSMDQSPIGPSSATKPNLKVDTRSPHSPRLATRYDYQSDNTTPLLQHSSQFSERLRIRDGESILGTTWELPGEQQEPEKQSEIGNLYDSVADEPQDSAVVPSNGKSDQTAIAFAKSGQTHVRNDTDEQPTQNTPSHTLTSSSSALKQIIEEPPPGMVFYPAPVPVILNLPPKLSKRRPASEVAKSGMRMLAADSKPRDPEVSSKHSAGDIHDASSFDEIGKVDRVPLPPQLRATLYFDQKPLSQNLQVQDGSAVATLDKLLDASAHAPVSAFTDHPIVGQIGAEVYGSTKNPRRTLQPLGNSAHGRNSASNEDLTENRESNDFDDDRLNEDGDVENQPTTLLAELQMRKQHQQSRNKTAAKAFPHGMHATLLQMDAVAQVQRNSRKQKQVKLAWEDSGGDADADANDDDVPLALLRGRAGDEAGHEPDDDKPLGLLAQRHLEDNEPLALRRARLRGEPPASASMAIDTSHRSGDNADTDANADDDQGETLAQRRRRLRIANAIPTAQAVSSDFTSEMLNQLGVPTATEEEGETLAQRRQRLHDAQRQSAPQLKPMPKSGYGVVSSANPNPRSTALRETQTASLIDLASPPAPPVPAAPFPRVMRQSGVMQAPAIGQAASVPTGDPRAAMVDRWRQGVR